MNASLFLSIHTNPRAIENVEQTKELCLKAIDINPVVIKYIREPTPEMYEKAMERRPVLIKDIPKEFLTTNIIKKVVSELGYLIQYIDDPTDEIYAAVEPTYGLPYLPDEFKTEEKCLEYLTSKINSYITDDFTIVLLDPSVFIKNVPERFYCNEFFLEVAKRGNLDRIPLKYRTEEIIYAALSVDSDNLSYIDDQNEEMCWFAIKRNPLSIKFVRKQTEEMKWYAIRTHYENVIDPTYTDEILEYIVDPTDEMIIECVRVNGANIRFVKEPSVEVIKLALKTYASAIIHVEQTEEICWLALTHDPRNIISLRQPTKEMFLHAFSVLEPKVGFLPCFRINLNRLHKNDLQGYLDVCRFVLEKDPSLYLVVHSVASGELTELAFDLYPELKERCV